MVQKDSYAFGMKKKYHDVLRAAAESSIEKRDPSKLVAVCFGAHELLEVKNVLLPVGYDPRNIYSIECHRPTLELALETHERDAVGMPAENFLRGKDLIILEKMIQRKKGVPHRPIDYLNLDYQGPYTNDKSYALRLAIGGHLLSRSALLATNFLSGREADGGKNHRDLRFYRRLLKRESLSEEPNWKEIAQDIVDDPEDRKLLEDREEAIVLSIYDKLMNGSAGLGLDAITRKFMIGAARNDDEKARVLLDRFGEAKTPKEIFEVMKDKYLLFVTESIKQLSLSTIEKMGHAPNMALQLFNCLMFQEVDPYYPTGVFSGSYLSDSNQRFLFDIFQVRRLEDRLPQIKGVDLTMLGPRGQTRLHVDGLPRIQKGEYNKRVTKIARTLNQRSRKLQVLVSRNDLPKRIDIGGL